MKNSGFKLLTALFIASALLLSACGKPPAAPAEDVGDLIESCTAIIDIENYGCISMYFQSACGDVRPNVTADFENKCWKAPMTFADIDAFSG